MIVEGFEFPILQIKGTVVTTKLLLSYDCQSGWEARVVTGVAAMRSMHHFCTLRRILLLAELQSWN